MAEAGLLHLLQAAAEEIWVPEPVAREILAYGDADPTASALASNPWLRNVPVSAVATAVIAWDLGPGESSVLTLALDQPGCGVVIQVAMASFAAVLFVTQVIILLPLAIWLRRRTAPPAR